LAKETSFHRLVQTINPTGFFLSLHLQQTKSKTNYSNNNTNNNCHNNSFNNVSFTRKFIQLHVEENEKEKKVMS